VNSFGIEETKRVAKHEIGHLLTLSYYHHDKFSSMYDEGGEYHIIGSDERDCVMNSNPQEKDDYLCQRCRTVARKKWDSIEEIAKIRILRD
ncbi:MAG: hypothetical protein NT001_04745, partial [Candidatus Woesearchaeota archaeon]|nr:hypothetical protein [Candidatus Woesearchaeota archaeon]